MLLNSVTFILQLVLGYELYSRNETRLRKHLSAFLFASFLINTCLLPFPDGRLTNYRM